MRGEKRGRGGGKIKGEEDEIWGEEKPGDKKEDGQR
jgi:hypothetical protein